MQIEGWWLYKPSSAEKEQDSLTFRIISSPSRLGSWKSWSSCRVFCQSWEKLRLRNWLKEAVKRRLLRKAAAAPLWVRCHHHLPCWRQPVLCSDRWNIICIGDLPARLFRHLPATLLGRFAEYKEYKECRTRYNRIYDVATWNISSNIQLQAFSMKLLESLNPLPRSVRTQNRAYSWVQSGPVLQSSVQYPKVRIDSGRGCPIDFPKQMSGASFNQPVTPIEHLLSNSLSTASPSFQYVLVGCEEKEASAANPFHKGSVPGSPLLEMWL